MAIADHDLEQLIECARDVSADRANRHQAFEEIVRRFQDLAFACACARLRDRALAEDAAQDAFLVAWQRLDQLREPAAFPAWIRRLVLTQCHRRLRSPRLGLRSEDEACGVAAPCDLAAELEASDDAMLVRVALAGLAPNDRLVLLLFYGSERTHEEIATWLGVPVTTVSRRLAHAKRRLRRQTLDALSGGLRAQHRAVRDAFILELSSRFRRAVLADASGITSLASHLGLDPAPTMPSVSCAYVVEDPASRRLIAYAAAAQTIFDPIYDVHLAIGARALERHAGDVLLAQIVQDLVARDAISLQHRTSARHAAVIEFLLSRGFQVIERTEDWRRETTGGSVTPPTACPVCEFKSVAAVSQEAGLFDQVRELLTETIADLPWGPAILPIHQDSLRRSLRRQPHGVLAIVDGAVQGLITASPDDIVPGGVLINIIAVRQNRRREGLATALLARLLAQHGDVPARLVGRTTSELRWWLTRCGFVHVTDDVVLDRILRKTVSVTRERLDEFVGRYVSEAPSESPIEIDIERHGDSLISKSRDMRDWLLPASATEFFTRHHYGRGRFERGASGRVTRLVCSEGPREFVAIRV